MAGGLHPPALTIPITSCAGNNPGIHQRLAQQPGVSVWLRVGSCRRPAHHIEPTNSCRMGGQLMVLGRLLGHPPQT